MQRSSCRIPILRMKKTISQLRRRCGLTRTTTTKMRIDPARQREASLIAAAPWPLVQLAPKTPHTNHNPCGFLNWLRSHPRGIVWPDLRFAWPLHCLLSVCAQRLTRIAHHWNRGCCLKFLWKGGLTPRGVAMWRRLELPPNFNFA